MGKGQKKNSIFQIKRLIQDSKFFKLVDSSLGTDMNLLSGCFEGSDAIVKMAEDRYLKTCFSKVKKPLFEEQYFKKQTNIFS